MQDLQAKQEDESQRGPGSAPGAFAEGTPEVSRLKYFIKVKTMERGRLVRELLRLGQGPAVKGQGLNHQWCLRIEELLNDDEGLTAAFDKVSIRRR